MFSLNGVPLEDAVRGWVERDLTTPLTGIEVDVPQLEIAGRDGYTDLPQRPRSNGGPIALVIETPAAGLPALRTVLRQRPLVLTRSDMTGIEAPVRLVSRQPEGHGPADEFVEVRVLLSIPGVYWRDVDTTTSDAEAIDGATVVVEVFPGSSAPVTDALVRVAGAVGGLRVTDTEGSFFTYSQALDAGDYLRFDSATGRAWVTDTDTWTGGTEVTRYIDNGPTAYPLELTPVFDTDPDDRRAVLTVVTTSRSGSPTIEVRGRGAHEV